MRVEPLGNINFSTGSARIQGDTSATINTTDSFQKSSAMDNLTGNILTQGKELLEIMKNSKVVVMESALNKSDNTTIQYLSIHKKEKTALELLHFLSDGSLAMIEKTIRTKPGERVETSLVFMKSSIEEKARVALGHDYDQVSKLVPTPDGRLFARDGEDWKCFSSDGKELWKTPFTAITGYQKSLYVADDGSALIWAMDKKKPGKNNYTVKAMAKDGTEKWEKSLTLDVMSVDTKGNTYYTSSDSLSYKKIDIYGNETEISFDRGDIPQSSRITVMEIMNSGKVIIETETKVSDQSGRDKPISSKYIVESGKKPIPISSTSIRNRDYTIEGPDGSILTMAKSSENEAELLCFDKEGNKIWEKQLPASDLYNKPFVDNQGRFYVETNSYALPGSHLPRPALTCYDKNGDEIWKHNLRNNLYIDHVVAHPNGNIEISDSRNSKLIELKPDKVFLEEVSKQMVEEDNSVQKTGNGEIRKSEDGKSINIGGVTLPIK